MLKKNKVSLYFALIALMCVLACLIWIEYQPAEVPFYFEVQSESGTEQYACWRGDNRQCYVFLPGYVDFSETRIVMNTDDTLYLDGKILDGDVDCSELQEDYAYKLIYKGLFVEQQLELTLVKSKQMPVIHIDTETGSMDYIHGKKGNEEKANIRIYSTDGQLVCSEALKSIAARGNSTFDEEKKPYSIHFTEPKDVLGMGEAEKWILLANALDLSNLRNQLVLETAQKMGMAYTPDVQWVELYLNSEYAGLYLLSEKIEVNENRVEIPLQDSYLFSLEDRGRVVTQNLPHYETKAGQVVRIRYPETPNEINLETLASIVQRAENAILSGDGIDPSSGLSWDELIDIDSWARKYLVEEIFANADAGKWSQYFYVRGGEQKIYAGPVWDYDISLALSWQIAVPNTWYCNRLSSSGEVIAPWFDALSRNPMFMQRVVEIYKDEALPILMELLDEGIAQRKKLVAQFGAMNSTRWFGKEEPEGEVVRIEEYLQARIQFLNDIWIEGNQYVKVMAYLGETDGYMQLMMPAGSFMDNLPPLQENDLLGWCLSADGTPVTHEQKVEQNMQIYAVRGETTKNNDRVIKLIPLGLIAMIGVVIAIVEICRLKNKGWHDHG